MEPMFKKGEKVLTMFTNKEGVVKEIVQRADGYEEKYQYLVEYESFSWFGLFKDTKYTEWELEGMLCKFIS